MSSFSVAPVSYPNNPPAMLIPMKEEELPPYQDLPVIPEYVPKCTHWLLLGMLLMGLNAYLPSLSPALSLWTPVQVDIPVLHWMAS
ncbi:hypothetical protein DSO57_1004190 [Entomophthora muscae]|uniref:Uncharacterized protein n=1 Tax=Entomophthora muscae TaxID=34485 RepID=A0ACC2UUD6_9FUNG|nr:hypothetical protein DSO57_1004190 [Entomophthora muscae]